MKFSATRQNKITLHLLNLLFTLSQLLYKTIVPRNSFGLVHAMIIHEMHSSFHSFSLGFCVITFVISFMCCDEMIIHVPLCNILEYAFRQDLKIKYSPTTIVIPLNCNLSLNNHSTTTTTTTKIDLFFNHFNFFPPFFLQIFNKFRS